MFAATRESLSVLPSPNPAANGSSSVIDHEQMLGVGLHDSTAFGFGTDCFVDFRPFSPPSSPTLFTGHESTSTTRIRYHTTW